MCDWSVTADIRQKDQQGTYVEYMGGCCHGEVAKHFPELAKFIPLHCSNHYGAPMYSVRNGIYHIRKSGISVAMKYLRISEQECVKLYIASEDELYFKYLLFSLGIVDRWKRESEELIKELEKMCGKKWVNPYMPEREDGTIGESPGCGSILVAFGEENAETLRSSNIEGRYIQVNQEPCNTHVDWEQRRYEIAKTILPITSVSGRGPHGELILETCDKAAELAVVYADDLIKKLK